MPRRPVDALPLHYIVADDGPAPPDLPFRAVLRARAIDELTLAPPRAPLSLSSNLRQALARIGDGGYLGLVARPRDVAHALLTPGGLRAVVEAPGYLPRDLTSAIDASRRALDTNAAFGDTVIDVHPPDTVPALQFLPGRGVLVARPAPTGADEYGTVAMVAVPSPPDHVALAEPLKAGHALGARVAGVPLTLPEQPLHRDATASLRGRMRRRTGPGSSVPAIGARVGIAGIWLAYPHTQTLAPVAAGICALAPALRFAHPVGATIQRVVLNAVGTARQLRQSCTAGERVIVVAPNLGLNPAGGDLLRIGDPLTGEADVVVSAGFAAVADPNLAVAIRLTAPIAYIHRAPAVVRDLAPGALAGAGSVAREALPGDRVLFAAGIGALPTTSMIAVEHGTARAAYYKATQYPATDGVTFSHQVAIGADGSFEWPPLARVAQLRVVASDPPLAPQQIDVALDYAGNNALDIVFS